MFVQKKYPKVDYTLHIELTQDDVRRLAGEVESVVMLMARLRSDPSTRLWLHQAYPNLADLLRIINQEVRLPYGC